MATLKVGVLGSGVVGETLANGFLEHGYEVMRGSRDPRKLSEWKSGRSKASVGTFEQTAEFADLVVIAVKGTAAESLVQSLPEGALTGKTVIDTNNPIAETPPQNGVLQFFTGPNDSLLERLQKKVPGAHFVKSFSCVGSAFMVNPKFPDGTPTMFICGNSDSAKATVREVLTQFGWETEDMGKAEAARAIEPLCMLWCIPGILNGEWSHAFKLLKL